MFKNRYYILWILLLATALRFIHIESPPVGRHAWRQSDTASVARNFHQNGHQLLYPQIDWEIPGYVEMEFPIYPWVTSLLYGAVGESTAVPRLLALLGSLATIGFLYLIALRILGRRAALWAAFLYAVLPLNLFFGRAIMPESWMLAASAGAVYFFLRWIDDESPVFWILALLSSALACLLKPTSLYLGLPLLWLAWQKWGRGTLARGSIWLIAAGVTVPMLLWYSHAYALGQEFGASFHILTAPGSDKWGAWQLLIDPRFYHRVFVANLGGRLLTWAGYLLLFVGLVLPRRNPLERLFDVWLVAVVVVLLLANGGAYQHGYYSLPILLPAAAIMGKVFDRGWETQRNALLFAAVVLVLLSGYRFAGMLAEERDPGIELAVAKALQEETVEGDLVISCNSANPVWLYLSARRGWGRDCSTMKRDTLQELIDRGAEFLVAEGGGEGRDPFPLSPFFEAFHKVRRRGDGVFLAKLDQGNRSKSPSWRTVFKTNLSTRTSLDSWRMHRGQWHFEDRSLTGIRTRKPAQAALTLPACVVCKVELGVALSASSNAEMTVSGIHDRRLEREKSHASIRLWWQEPDTGLVLTLGSRSDHVALHQVVDAEKVASARAEFPWIEDRIYSIEIESDLFGFELLVDGLPLIELENQLPVPLEGSLVLQPRLGALRFTGVQMLVPTAIAADAQRPR